ncbi:MAG TPA: TonB family protein [Aquifex aeolicus]|nr:TonB family protein [Aquifex aeolicus]
MGKSLAEQVLYFLISIFINLLFLKILFYYLFNVNLPQPQIYQALRVEIKEVKVPSLSKKAEKTKTTERNTEKAKKITEPKTLTAVEKSFEKGDVPVKVKQQKQEEEISILPELEKKIKRKLAEREKLKKEIGEISAVVSKKNVEIKAGSRKLVYTPSAPVFKVKEFPSQVKIKIWVNPEGKVIKAIIVQRSGVASIDDKLLRFVKKLKFEEIDTFEVQEGVITFRFAT